MVQFIEKNQKEKKIIFLPNTATDVPKFPFTIIITICTNAGSKTKVIANETFTTNHELEKIKSTNLGSMFELSYQIQLKKEIKEKEMLDAIRCRNGNLTVLLSKKVAGEEQL